MSITICGHEKAVQLLKKEPCAVVFISSPNDKFAVRNSELIPTLATDYCELLFNDVIFASESDIRRGQVIPDANHVRTALDFAKDKENLIVCCQMGVSRSSSIAYVIAASKLGLEEALKILNPKVHCPNDLVIKLGSTVLDEPRMEEVVKAWKAKNDMSSGLMWD